LLPVPFCGVDAFIDLDLLPTVSKLSVRSVPAPMTVFGSLSDAHEWMAKMPALEPAVD